MILQEVNKPIFHSTRPVIRAHSFATLL